MTTVGLPTTTESVPSPLPTQYRAETLPNGALAVRGVPIFAENRRQVGAKQLAFDRAWLDGALAAYRRLSSTGYRPPMHFGHHGIVADRERAGHFELDEVRLCLYQGTPTWVLFGSLVFTDRGRLEKSLKDYPYRSVELASGDAPAEINTLALLGSEAPYFRFPNLENLSYAALSDGGRAFAWSEKLAMADETTNFAYPVAKGPASSVNVNSPAPVASAQGAGPSNGLPKTPAPPSGIAQTGAQYDADDGYDAASDADAFKKASINRLRYISAVIKRKFDADDGSSGGDSGSADSSAGGDDAGAPVVSAKAATDSTARLEGQLLALKAELARLRKTQDDEKMFSTLRSELVAYQLPNLDTEIRKRLAKGPDHAREWADGIRMVPPARSSASDDEPEPGNDAPEVARYAARGAQSLAAARRLAAVYAASPSTHFVRKHTLAAFLASQLPEEK